MKQKYTEKNITGAFKCVVHTHSARDYMNGYRNIKWNDLNVRHILRV